MADEKAVLLEHLEIVKNYIDNKDVKNIKSAEFVDDTLKFYTTEDKSGEAVAEITLPEETFLDVSKTELVSDFTWSITKYPKSIDPELDGKAVLVLAVKSGRTVRYSFVALDSVVSKLMGEDTNSTSVSVADDVVSLSVRVSELSDNRVVLKEDGLYVGTIDNTPDWTISTDDEVSELFSVGGSPAFGTNTLGSRNVGDVVKIKENGVDTNFIVVHKGNPDPEMYDASCDGMWLLRENVLENRKWGSGVNDYENSTMNMYLNTDYIDLFSVGINDQIKSVKIPYVKGAATSRDYKNGSDGLLCKIFLLSGDEICGESNDGNTYMYFEGHTLSYFKDAPPILTENSAKRVCNGVNGLPAGWWTRSGSKDFGSNAYNCDTKGKASGYDKVTQLSGVRPAFILPYDVSVDSDGVITA